jgi:hypothetical protein
VTLVGNNLGFYHVEKIELDNHGCQRVLKGGVIKGALHTGISVNFATFGWNLLDGKAVQGFITNAAVHTYISSSVEWPTLKQGNCVIKGKNVAIYPQ